MKIHSAIIENFKNIASAEIQAHGNNVRVRGMCGTGKTAILEALITALLGKEALPDDPIRHGQESAKITLNLGNGKELVYTIAVSIGQGGTFALKLNTYDAAGRKLTVSAPQALLKEILFKHVIDPQEFYNLDDREQLKMLYTILPGLQGQLDAIDADYKTLQDKRSEIRKAGENAKLDLERTPFTPGLPETEINPADLMQHLQNAMDFNQKKKDLENKLVESNAKIVTADGRRSLTLDKIQSLKDQIENLQTEMARHMDSLSVLDIDRQKLNDEKAVIETGISNFVEQNTTTIRKEIETVQDTNANIRTNLKRKELEGIVEDQRTLYTLKLNDMKKLENDRVEVIRSANMPIKGLSIGDGCLLFPDPKTGEPVRINSLSTGQKWPVVLRILAAFYPKNGLRIMFIGDKNSLDEPNVNALYKAASELNVQLILHETAYKTDDDSCQIIIEECTDDQLQLAATA